MFVKHVTFRCITCGKYKLWSLSSQFPSCCCWIALSVSFYSIYVKIYLLFTVSQVYFLLAHVLLYIVI